MNELLTLVSCLFIVWPWTTCAIEVNGQEILSLDQQVADLTRRLQLLEENCNTALLTRYHEQQSSLQILNIDRVPLKNCKRILEEDRTATSGLYRISPCGDKLEFTVYCEMKAHGGGWTVIQQRKDNTTDFYRNWEGYRIGFGDFETNFWLGLDKIHCLSQSEPHELIVKMSDFDDETAESKYGHFKVGNRDSGYQLHIGSYNSSCSTAGDALEIHNGRKFSTYDTDNDDDPAENCAMKYHGAWWYRQCFESNLNGRYYHTGTSPIHDGVTWLPFTGNKYSVKTVTMAIRPK